MSAKLAGIVLIVVGFYSQAPAFSSGVFGYSGAGSETCTQCHSGAAAPAVGLSGPTTLAPGETATYTFDVITGATSRVAGFDVSASAGALAAILQNNASFLNNGEISHKTPLAKGATVQWRFDFTAPAAGGPVTLFAAGLSADNNGTTSNDGTATTTLAIDVASPPDLAGADFAGVVVDLATVDAISAATAQEPSPMAKADLGPPHDEAHWACACNLAAAAPPPSGLPWLVFGLALVSSRWRRCRRRP